MEAIYCDSCNEIVVSNKDNGVYVCPLCGAVIENKNSTPYWDDYAMNLKIDLL